MVRVSKEGTVVGPLVFKNQWFLKILQNGVPMMITYDVQILHANQRAGLLNTERGMCIRMDKIIRIHTRKMNRRNHSDHSNLSRFVRNNSLL
jgi:hypothetical protein